MYSSPFSSRRKSPIRISHSVPHQQSKSPAKNDRYINITPRKLLSDDSSESNSPFSRSPSKKQIFKAPKIDQIKLDAPDLYDALPSKLIAWNDRGELAIALGTKVYIYDPVTEDIIDLIPDGFSAVIQAICWFGHKIIISGAGQIEIWSVKKMRRIRTLIPHNGRGCAISVCGNRIATGGLDGIVRIYDMANRTTAEVFQADDEILSLSWSPEGEYLAISSGNCTVYVIGDRIQKEFPHHAKVHAMTWIQNTLITGDISSEGNIYRYRIPSGNGGLCVTTGSGISGLHWSEKWGLILTNTTAPSYCELYGNDMRLYARYQVESEEALGLAFCDKKDYISVISASETLMVAKLQDQNPPKARTPSPFKCTTNVR